MLNTSTLYLLVALLAISLLTFGLIIGCDEQQIKSPVIGPSAGSGPVGGGDAQSIKLTATPSKTITALAGAQATAQINAIVENNIGQPMPDGTVVYWTATNGTLSSVTTTTSSGASAVTLTFPLDFSGNSVVTATAGDATGSITINVISVTPTGTPSKGLAVSANQTTIAHRGTTKITAFVSTDGEPDANIQVNFSASGAGILQESSAITDKNGNASVTLIGNNTSSGDQTATVNVTTADGRTGSVSVIVSGGATPTPAPTVTAAATATPAIFLSVNASPTTVSVSGAGGVPTQSTITAFTSTGGSADNAVVLNFNLTAPGGTGTLSPSGSITTGPPSFPNGTAESTFTGTNPGNATVTVTRGSLTQSVIITVEP